MQTLIRTLNNELLASYMAEDVRFRSFSDGETFITLVFCMGIPMTQRTFSIYLSERLTSVAKAATESERTEIVDLWSMGMEIPQDAIKRVAEAVSNDDFDLSPFDVQFQPQVGDGQLEVCRKVVEIFANKLTEEEGGLAGLKRVMRDLDYATEIAAIEVTPMEMTLFPESISRIWL